jgi:hypothetical protein
VKAISELSRSARGVMLYLITLPAEENGYRVFVTGPAMEAVGINRASVCSAVTQLVKAGWIELVKDERMAGLSAVIRLLALEKPSEGGPELGTYHDYGYSYYDKR